MARRYVPPSARLTADDVRRVVREEMAAAGAASEGSTASGAALDSLPAARSWGAFLAAISDPDDQGGHQAAMARALDAARPRNANLSERVPSEGGALVPERLRAQVLTYMTPAIIRPRALHIPMDSLRVPIPTLDNPSQASSAQALGGLTFSMVAEGATIPATTANFSRLALEARKFVAFLTSVPNELVDDATAFTDVFLPITIAQGLSWAEDDMFVNGTGVGEPQGLLNAPAALSQSRAASSHVQIPDIVGMLKQLHPQSKWNGTAVWLIGDDAFGEILDLAVNTGSATSGYTSPSMWLEYDEDRGYWKLLGLPAFPTDHQPSLGSTGDVILADLRLLLVGDTGEMRVERSQKGSGFPGGTSNFRFRHRVDARFWPQSAYTLASGQVTSPLVILHS